MAHSSTNAQGPISQTMVLPKPISATYFPYRNQNFPPNPGPSASFNAQGGGQQPATTFTPPSLRLYTQPGREHLETHLNPNSYHIPPALYVNGNNPHIQRHIQNGSGNHETNVNSNQQGQGFSPWIVKPRNQEEVPSNKSFLNEYMNNLFSKAEVIRDLIKANSPHSLQFTGVHDMRRNGVGLQTMENFMEVIQYMVTNKFKSLTSAQLKEEIDLIMPTVNQYITRFEILISRHPLLGKFNENMKSIKTILEATNLILLSEIPSIADNEDSAPAGTVHKPSPWKWIVNPPETTKAEDDSVALNQYISSLTNKALLLRNIIKARSPHSLNFANAHEMRQNGIDLAVMERFTEMIILKDVSMLNSLDTFQLKDQIERIIAETNQYIERFEKLISNHPDLADFNENMRVIRHMATKINALISPGQAESSHVSATPKQVSLRERIFKIREKIGNISRNRSITTVKVMEEYKNDFLSVEKHLEHARSFLREIDIIISIKLLAKISQDLNNPAINELLGQAIDLYASMCNDEFMMLNIDRNKNVAFTNKLDGTLAYLNEIRTSSDIASKRKNIELAMSKLGEISTNTHLPTRIRDLAYKYMESFSKINHYIKEIGLFDIDPAIERAAFASLPPNAKQTEKLSLELQKDLILMSREENSSNSMRHINNLLQVASLLKYSDNQRTREENLLKALELIVQSNRANPDPRMHDVLNRILNLYIINQSNCLKYLSEHNPPSSIFVDLMEKMIDMINKALQQENTLDKLDTIRYLNGMMRIASGDTIRHSKKHGIFKNYIKALSQIEQMLTTYNRTPPRDVEQIISPITTTGNINVNIPTLPTTRLDTIRNMLAKHRKNSANDQNPLEIPVAASASASSNLASQNGTNLTNANTDATIQNLRQARIILKEILANENKEGNILAFLIKRTMKKINEHIRDVTAKIQNKEQDGIGQLEMGINLLTLARSSLKLLTILPEDQNSEAKREKLEAVSAEINRAVALSGISVIESFIGYITIYAGDNPKYQNAISELNFLKNEFERLKGVNNLGDQNLALQDLNTYLSEIFQNIGTLEYESYRNSFDEYTRTLNNILQKPPTRAKRHISSLGDTILAAASNIVLKQASFEEDAPMTADDTIMKSGSTYNPEIKNLFKRASFEMIIPLHNTLRAGKGGGELMLSVIEFCELLQKAEACEDSNQQFHYLVDALRKLEKVYEEKNKFNGNTSRQRDSFDVDLQFYVMNINNIITHALCNDITFMEAHLNTKNIQSLTDLVHKDINFYGYKLLQVNKPGSYSLQFSPIADLRNSLANFSSSWKKEYQNDGVSSVIDNYISLVKRLHRLNGRLYDTELNEARVANEKKQAEIEARANSEQSKLPPITGVDGNIQERNARDNNSPEENVQKNNGENQEGSNWLEVMTKVLDKVDKAMSYNHPLFGLAINVLESKAQERPGTIHPAERGSCLIKVLKNPLKIFTIEDTDPDKQCFTLDSTRQYRSKRATMDLGESYDSQVMNLDSKEVQSRLMLEPKNSPLNNAQNFENNKNIKGNQLNSSR